MSNYLIHEEKFKEDNFIVPVQNYFQYMKNIYNHIQQKIEMPPVVQEHLKQIHLLFKDENKPRIFLEDEVLDKWFRKYTSISKLRVKFSSYQINRIFLNALMSSPNDWSPLFCEVLQFVHNDVSQPSETDSEKFSAIKKSYPHAFLNNISFILKIKLNTRLDQKIKTGYANLIAETDKSIILFEYLFLRLFSHPIDDRSKILGALELKPEDLNEKYRMENGATALYVAAEHANHLHVMFLLYNKADPNLGLNNGWTPLLVATEKRNIGITCKLLDSHVLDPVKQVFPDERTFFHLLDGGSQDQDFLKYTYKKTDFIFRCNEQKESLFGNYCRRYDVDNQNMTKLTDIAKLLSYGGNAKEPEFMEGVLEFFLRMSRLTNINNISYPIKCCKELLKCISEGHLNIRNSLIKRIAWLVVQWIENDSEKASNLKYLETLLDKESFTNEKMALTISNISQWPSKEQGELWKKEQGSLLNIASRLVPYNSPEAEVIYLRLIRLKCGYLASVHLRISTILKEAEEKQITLVRKNPVDSYAWFHDVIEPFSQPSITNSQYLKMSITFIKYVLAFTPKNETLIASLNYYLDKNQALLARIQRGSTASSTWPMFRDLFRDSTVTAAPPEAVTVHVSSPAPETSNNSASP